MTDVSIVGPDDGELALSGPIQMRILEDGQTTEHRLGMGEITIAPHTDRAAAAPARPARRGLLRGVGHGAVHGRRHVLRRAGRAAW